MDTTTEVPTTGRKETPTARLVLSVDAPRAQWLEARQNGITATDLVAIMGQSKFKTAYDVWCDKTMPLAYDEAGEAAFWGTRLEDPVAQAWAERHDVKIRRIGLVANEAKPWAMASLDRMVTGCPDGKCALEVKTRSLYVAETWEQSLPQDVETQCQWQLMVTGLDHIHVAALIGGQRMVEHLVTPDATLWAELTAAAELVWRAAKDGLPPDMPPELWSTDYLDKRHSTRSGETELRPEVLVTIREYQDVVMQIKALDERKAEIRTRLVGELGDAETGRLNGQNAYTYKPTNSRRIDTKSLTALYPNVETDERVWNTTTTRNLRITLKETK